MLKVIFVLIPALIHGYIFVLESLLWGRPRTNATFGVKPDAVQVIRPWAFNQGFYNLFLGGILVAAAIVGPATAAGLALSLAGCAAITGAGLVLLISAPQLWRSALIQIVPATAAALVVLLTN